MPNLKALRLYGNQTIMRNRTKRFQSPMTILRSLGLGLEASKCGSGGRSRQARVPEDAQRGDEDKEPLFESHGAIEARTPVRGDLEAQDCARVDHERGGENEVRQCEEHAVVVLALARSLLQRGGMPADDCFCKAPP